MSKKENAEVTEEKVVVDRRHKKIKKPDGTEVKRTEYIRELWQGREMTRSQIRDHINNDCTSDDGSNEIAYQIVFAATKDLDGGISKEEEAKRKEAAKAEKEKAKEESKEAAE